MIEIKLWVNGKPYQELVAPDTLLFDWLRKNGYKSVKCGCDTTNCGICTVWVDNVPKLSCSVLVARANGAHITTLEGLEEEARVFADFMAEQGADQCGYCSPGYIMNLMAMKRENQVHTEESIKKYLAGNLCRCTGYMGQLRAIKKYLGVEEGSHESC